MTHYGLNPSFVYSSPLPLFSNLIRRGRRVEADGRVKLMEPGHGLDVADLRAINGRPVESPGGRLEFIPDPGVALSRCTAGLGRPAHFHPLSIAALAALRPAVLRTLDWQMTNKRPDWAKPRTLTGDVLQGTDAGMAVEYQVAAASFLNCALWWCAPPRFELGVVEYEARLEEYLRAIKATTSRAPILEYGNELWNAGFPVHQWLKMGNEPAEATQWQLAAAREIAILKRVADRVFGPPGPLGARPYYLFVGGQLTVPSHLDRILSALDDLGVTPDIAGPALYVTPLKAHREEWEATGAVPSQDELRASCFARLEEITHLSTSGDAFDGPLVQHNRVLDSWGVPYFACYEAGQSLLAGSHPWRRAAIEAQPTEWMGDLYREIRQVAEGAGVDLLNWYSAATDQTPGDARVDVFGLLEGTDLTKMLPKARAARGD